jgi:hypothetical protein
MWLCRLARSLNGIPCHAFIDTLSITAPVALLSYSNRPIGDLSVVSLADVWDSHSPSVAVTVLSHRLLSTLEQTQKLLALCFLGIF